MRNGDYWEENDQVFVHHGQRWGVRALRNKDGLIELKSVLLPPVDTIQDVAGASVNGLQQGEQGITGSPDTPPELSVPLCAICGREVLGKRADRTYCSNRCRHVASRRERKARQLVLIK